MNEGRKKRQREKLTFYVDSELKQDLMELSERYKLSVTAIATMAIVKFVEKEKKKGKQC